MLRLDLEPYHCRCKGIPEEQRICVSCDVEDEFHLFVLCHVYRELKHHLFEKIHLKSLIYFGCR